MFRELFDEIHRWDEKRIDLFWSVLEPWVKNNVEAGAFLREFGDRKGDPIPVSDIDELIELYALSRVSDILLQNFQSHYRADPRLMERRFRLTVEEYATAFQMLGFRPLTIDSYTPVLHEIVEVIPSDDPDQPIELLEQRWPTLMLGNMVFARAGVAVIGGERHINKEIAETSTLFWAYHRVDRPVEDLSVGWGHNSQWATRFRRDYVVDGKAYLNVDGKSGTAAEDRTLTALREKLGNHANELLLYRCFVVSDVPNARDLWPYDERMTLDSPSDLSR
jgi:hypothetical protein